MALEAARYGQLMPATAKMAAAKAFRLPLPESSLKTTLEQQTKLPLKAAGECNTITPARPPAGIVFPPFMERDMKKLLPLALICTAAFAHAHEVWVNAPAELPAKSSLKAELAYSHDFPHAEAIPVDRLHIFAPLHITSPDGKTVALKQQGENYQYVSGSLKKGSYIVSATYKPTFWSKDAAGKWAQKNLAERPEAVSCQQSQMFGKAVVVVDGGADETAISRPVGQTLEIVPLANPNSLQPGQALPVQILYQGEPLAGATVTATSDTFAERDSAAAHDHREPQAFSGQTDKQGKVNVLPLIEGLWKVKVVHKTPFADAKVCQESAAYATLVMPIGKERAQGHGHHHHHHH